MRTEKHPFRIHVHCSIDLVCDLSESILQRNETTNPNNIMSTIPTRVFCWGSGAGGALGVDVEGRLRRHSLSPVDAPLMAALGGGGGGEKRTKEQNAPSPPSASPARFVAAGYQVSTVVTESGECYTWGGGETGRRVSVSVSSSKRPRPGADAGDRHAARIVRIPGAVSGVCHGRDHSVAVTADGAAYGWGDASDGRLGMGGTRRRTIALPQRVPFAALAHGQRPSSPSPSHRIGAVACGDRHTLLLLLDECVAQGHTGTLLAMGANDAGQLGICGGRDGGKQQKQASVPRPIALVSAKIEAICCGANHSAAASSRGDLYTWGWGEKGRLGHGDEEMRPRPELVRALAQKGIEIASVACGASHTCALTRRGDVLAFGWNAYGQVGGEDEDEEKEREESSLLPRMCLRERLVTDIKCGSYHSGALTIAGELLMWGFNEEGQLGLGHERNVRRPTRVDFPAHGKGCDAYAVSLALGHTHTLCVTSDATLSQIQGERERAMATVCARADAALVLLRFARRVLLLSSLRRLASSRLAADSVGAACSEESPPVVTFSPDVPKKVAAEIAISSPSTSGCSEDDNDDDDDCDYDDEIDSKKEEVNPVTTSNGEKLVEEWLQDYADMEKELRCMEYEDARSREASAFWAEAAKTQAADEEAARLGWELERMKAEDAAGKALDREERRQAALLKRMQREQRLAEMAERARESRVKEAERMNRAREKLAAQTRSEGFTVVPARVRRRASFQSDMQPRPMPPPPPPLPRNQDALPKEMLSRAAGLDDAPMKPTEKKNTSLIQNRQRRLEEREKKERAEEHRRIVQLEEERARKDREERRQLFSLHRTMEKRRIQRMTELWALKSSLGLGCDKSEFGVAAKDEGEMAHCLDDGTRKAGFMTANQWGKKLDARRTSAILKRGD